MTADLISDLVAANLAAGAAILFIAAVRSPLRRVFGARLVYAAWLIVPVAMAAALLPAPPAALAIAGPGAPQGLRLVFDDTVAGSVAWRQVALALWLAGAGASLLAVAFVHHRAIRRLRLARPGKGKLLRTRAPVSGPAVIGLIATRIVLPADFEQRFTASEQAVILRHEEVHLANGDVRVNAAVVLASCLFWFNPLVHLAAFLVRIDQELACDETVVARFPEARRTYAEALLKTQVASASLPLGCYWPQRSHQALKERLNMLTLKSPGRGRRIAGAALLAAVGLGTSYVAWAAAPQDAKPSPDRIDWSQVDEKMDTELPLGPQLTNSHPGAGAAMPAQLRDVTTPIPEGLAPVSDDNGPARAETIRAPAGFKAGMLAALGLPADAKLQLGCTSPGTADCTYSSNDGVKRPLPPAAQDAMRRLDPRFAGTDAFVPVNGR